MVPLLNSNLRQRQKDVKRIAQLFYELDRNFEKIKNFYILIILIKYVENLGTQVLLII